MNIELKSEVLQQSILIEDYLSRILMKLFLIRKTEPKTLGHSGTALSFKSKADLLYDLEKIDKDLYNDLMTFMEIRNQFIHNADTNSFELVIHNRINRKKNFIEFVNGLKLSETEIEKKYNNGFHRFSASIIQLLNETERIIWDERLTEIKKELELFKKAEQLNQSEMYLKLLSESIDEIIGIFGNRFKEIFNDKEDIAGKLKSGIQQLFAKKVKDYLNKN